MQSMLQQEDDIEMLELKFCNLGSLFHAYTWLIFFIYFY